MADVEEAMKMYAWVEALDWKILPRAGGLEDQDEVLMANMFAIADSIRRIRDSRAKRNN
jgi:hypothetical protein